MISRITTAVVATAFALVGMGAASAQGRAPGQYFDPMRQAPPLTVRKHLPFTESGTNAPVGYEDDYFVEQTTAHLPVYSSFRPDAFGQDVLPGRFGEIGRGVY